MPRMITLGAAQTGPVNDDDWRPNVRGACAMIEEAGRRKVDILSCAELAAAQTSLPRWRDRRPELYASLST